MGIEALLTHCQEKSLDNGDSIDMILLVPGLEMVYWVLDPYMLHNTDGTSFTIAHIEWCVPFPILVPANV